MRSFSFITIATLLALTGCAGTTEKQKNAYLNQIRYNLSDTASCCSSYADFDYITLNKTGSKEIDINSASQAYTFKEGKSFFQAFKLPSAIAGYTVRLQTWNVIPDQSAFENARFSFDPVVLFLDKDFTPIDHLQRFTMTHFESFTMNGREANFTLTGRRSKARYMVVYTNPKKVGTPLEDQGGGMAEFNYIMNDLEDSRDITRSSEGTITISIRR